MVSLARDEMSCFCENQSNTFKFKGALKIKFSGKKEKTAITVH